MAILQVSLRGLFDSIRESEESSNWGYESMIRYQDKRDFERRVYEEDLDLVEDF